MEPFLQCRREAGTQEPGLPWVLSPLAGHHPAQASLTTDPILELSSLLTYIPQVPMGRHSESPSKRTDQTQTVNSQNLLMAPVSPSPMT